MSRDQVDAVRAALERPPDSVATLRAKLAIRRAAIGTRRSLVDEGELLDELIQDLDGLEEAEATEWLSYAEASRVSGYCAKQLTRLAEAARVDFRGDNRNRRFRRGSLPIKRPSRAPAEVSTPSSAVPRVRAAPAAPAAPARAAQEGIHTSGARPSPVAPRRRRAYDPTADAQRFVRKADTMEDSP